MINRPVLNAYHRLITSNPNLYHISKRFKSKNDKSKRCSFQLQDNTNVVTTASGAPISNKTASISVGMRGPLLLEDVQLVEDLAHLARERIPERVVHAKGGGAFGYFEVTDGDITKYCCAKLFDTVGKKTKVAARFSTTGGEAGSADTIRDPRGFAVKFYTEDGNLDLVGNNTPVFFAVKFYTEDGNLDLVGNNTPVFFIRDPIFFPNLVHSVKRNPATHLPDADMFWDFMSLRSESTHQIFILFGERGIPDGFRHMNGYGGHTYKLVNQHGECVYCKFHLLTEQGIQCLDPEEATCIAGKAPDYSIADLYEAIADGNFPKWTVYIQVMTFEQAEQHPENPFDLTKVWSHKAFPMIKIGYFVLNKNPKNYFAEVEQLGFSPAHLVPGIMPSPDRMLAGRIFSYGDAQRYRLGKNYQQLPVNCPLRVKNYHRDGAMVYNNQVDGPNYYPNCPLRVKNYHRDGAMVYNNQVDGPNYYPNSTNGPAALKANKKLEPPFNVAGDVSRFDSGDDDNFTQARILYQNIFDEDQQEKFVVNVAGSLGNIFDEDQQEKFVVNVAGSLGEVKSSIIQRRALDNFAKVDSNLEKRISDYLQNKK
ncbi:Catalase-related immune-responsive [Popillia japonica]|uniref:Catalase-related immune-responsive n=1 Tax=Popillia japonica TaxID=7064 RepID=A0AAW1JZG6_POPJA